MPFKIVRENIYTKYMHGRKLKTEQKHFIMQVDLRDTML